MAKTNTNKKVFDLTVEDKVLKLAVIRPTHNVQLTGQKIYNRAFRDAVLPTDGGLGALLRERVKALMREQKLWDDDKEKSYQDLSKTIDEGVLTLKKGGIKLTEARAIALQVRTARLERQVLLAEQQRLDQNTAEAQAENARFNYFVSACTVNGETGEVYFKGYDDYLARQDDEVANTAATKLAQLMFGYDEESEKKLAENAFLLTHKFMDDKLRLINKDAKLVDEAGRLVNEAGYLVDENGQLIDEAGRPRNEDGSHKVETAPFLDDEGVPLPG